MKTKNLIFPLLFAGTFLQINASQMVSEASATQSVTQEKHPILFGSHLGLPGYVEDCTPEQMQKLKDEQRYLYEAGMHLLGKKDFSQARTFFENASGFQYLKADLYVGLCHEQEGNIKSAFDWYKSATRCQDTRTAALEHIGDLYATGKYSTSNAATDNDQMLKYYTEAAKRGSKTALRKIDSALQQRQENIAHKPHSNSSSQASSSSSGSISSSASSAKA